MSKLRSRAELMPFLLVRCHSRYEIADRLECSPSHVSKLAGDPLMLRRATLVAERYLRLFNRRFFGKWSHADYNAVQRHVCWLNRVESSYLWKKSVFLRGE